ncbi:MAG: hypothetical protein EP343_19160 [Deltaproteobacteria bacterium]|nr:MAG: hypothetical protein EP343_19160 [Deltaproteobacteria bacterium]
MQERPPLPTNIKELDEPTPEEQEAEELQEPTQSFMNWRWFATFVLGLAIGFSVLFVLVPRLLQTDERTVYQNSMKQIRTIWKNVVEHYKANLSPRGQDRKGHRFLCEGKGWICLPLHLPCRTGNPMYMSSELRLNHSCWKQLGYQPLGNSYYQLCYRSDGKGKKATFTLEAHANLDCDNVIQSYIIRGSIDPKSHTPVVPYPIFKNPLE